MDDEIDTLLIGVRADGRDFARDIAAMRAQLSEGLSGGAERAGQAIETSLLRAVRSGKLGFDDLKAVALRSLNEIAGASVQSAFGGGSGLSGLLGSLVKGALGLPGRATGGPVAPGAAYVVGERGPELFVPTSSGTIAASAPAAAVAREVRVSIAINAPGTSEPRALAQSSRQVARALARALDAAER
jgi:phage-related minor tail protein